MREEFLRDWFGLPGREGLIGNPEKKAYRIFLNNRSEFLRYVEEREKLGEPCYLSVQRFKARNQPCAIEKVYFDFDCKENVSKAWKEALDFAEKTIKYYHVLPLICFSGGKGYNVYCFLQKPLEFNPENEELAKQVYSMLQNMLLKGCKYETCDPQVLGDIKRLSRVPFTRHQKTGKICQPVSFTHRFLERIDLEVFREYGISEGLIQMAIRKVKEKNLREKGGKSAFSGKNSKVRPCIREALNKPLEGENGHLMRLAIAVEYLNKGYGVEEVVPLFKNQPDFKPEKTRYYVLDAKKKAYKPFKCETIRKLGFCLGSSCPIFQKKRKERIVIGEA